MEKVVVCKDIQSDLKKQYIEAKRIINEAQNDGQLVLFVGAGPSVSAGMPSWHQAVSAIANKLGIEKITSEDYLRIPQFYYNAREKKEYTQLMQEIFHYKKHLSSQLVHDQIISFNTQTIITTNYDNLIEQAAEKNSEMIRVISKDADLPYRKTGRELVKIHGDFENDNFVLKEDDYLHYSQNFKLIENYIKSIIGTKVVLFIGYSFNDPDIKHIFSWAKDILHGDFQPAYLIEAGNYYDLNADTYFKKLGVNVLYSSVQLGDDFCNDNKTQNLESMLRWILDKGNKSKLEELHDRLNIFKDFEYSYSSYIESSFIKLEFTINSGYIAAEVVPSWHQESKDYEMRKQILNAIAYERFIQNPKEVYVKDHHDNNISFVIDKNDALTDSEVDLIKDILKILNKSSIRGIILFVPISEELPHLENEQIFMDRYHRVFVDFDLLETFPKWLDCICRFDDKELEIISKSNNSKLNDDTPELYMEQACIYSYFDEYLAAYNCLRTAASLYYRKDRKVQYYIAETNRFYIGKLIQDYGALYGVQTTDIDEVSKEIMVLDLERTYRSLPDLGAGNTILKEISSFGISYKLFQDAFRISEKIKEEAKNKYLFSALPAFSKMRNSIYDFYCFESLNYIILDKYLENSQIYKLYFQSLLTSAHSPDLGNEENDDEPSNIHIKSLSNFELFLAIKYVTFMDLTKLYADIDVIDLDKNGMEYLKDVIACVDKPHTNWILSQDIPFWKIILMLGHINLDNELFDVAISKLCEFANGPDYSYYRKVIIKFIDNAETCSALDSDNIMYIHKLLSDIFGFLSNGNYTELLVLSDLINFLAYLCHKHNFAYDDNKIISSLFDEGARMICLEIYPFIGDDSRRAIKEKSINWSNFNSIEEFKQYCVAVGNEVIGQEEEIEKRILEFCRNEKEKTESEQKKDAIVIMHGIDTPEYEQLLCMLCDLYLRDFIINKKEVVETIKNIGDSFSKWLIDLDDFDYSLFEVTWLNRCYPILLKKIADNKKAKSGISKKVAEEYENGRIDRRTMKKFFRYFVN